MSQQSREEVAARAEGVFRRIFKDPSLKIWNEMTAKDVKRWDSLNHINLMIEIEKEFRVKFRTAEIVGLTNVGELIDTLVAKLAG